MRTILVTGSDTGVGKTRVTAALARLLGEGGASVQIVKVVETGVAPGGEGDAVRAARMSGGDAATITLLSFRDALAPAAAARAVGAQLSREDLLERVRALPPCDWRICEGAGGIASPLDAEGGDWADFGSDLAVDAAVIVVPDRLGAINQARLAFLRASAAGLRAGVWLNAVDPVDAAVARSNRVGLSESGVPVWAEQGHGEALPTDPAPLISLLNPPLAAAPAAPARIGDRCRDALAGRDRKRQRRTLRVTARTAGILDLSGNDYLDLARDPELAAAASRAIAAEGTSASASPLITGWREPHARLVDALCAWHGFSHGLIWTSGYAANAAVLGELPREGDLVLADRLIHRSMIAGLTRSGARLIRYPHLDLDRLEAILAEHRAGRDEGCIFVVTESVFSMDGDYPDMARLGRLKHRFGFCLVVDEAHALGWYGPGGSGLVRATGIEGEVDVLVGTLGKTLASGGAYTLFRDEALRDFLVNSAGEFIYSTALPPANAAIAEAALARVRDLAAGQSGWHAISREFRAALRADGWAAPDGDSPIIPVRLDDEGAALGLAEALGAAGIRAAAVRPPTVPAGTSRLRFSIRRTFTAADGDRILAVMRAWRKGDR